MTEEKSKDFPTAQRETVKAALIFPGCVSPFQYCAAGRCASDRNSCFVVRSHYKENDICNILVQRENSRWIIWLCLCLRAFLDRGDLAGRISQHVHMKRFAWLHLRWKVTNLIISIFFIIGVWLGCILVFVFGLIFALVFFLFIVLARRLLALFLSSLFFFILFFYLFNLFGQRLFFEAFCLALCVDDWRAKMLVLQMCGAHEEEVLSKLATFYV